MIKVLQSSKHRWELPVLHYHEILVIYPYPFFVVITKIRPKYLKDVTISSGLP